MPTGWKTAFIGANRYTLPADEKPPADDALHPMAFLVEKGPGAVSRPHFHQADQFQVVVAGRRASLPTQQIQPVTFRVRQCAVQFRRLIDPSGDGELSLLEAFNGAILASQRRNPENVD